MTNKMKQNEIGAIKKEWGGKVPMAVVYPNSYHVGMSNLALHQLYRFLNADKQIVAERVFLQKDGQSRSIESNRPISDFSVVMFTFSFEADYLNIEKIVGKDISPAPLMIAGGPAVTMNPTALSEIFDVIFLGEMEDVFEDVKAIIREFSDKKDLLNRLAKLDGFLVPGINSLEKVKRVYTKDLNKHPTHSTIWTDDTEFGHMHLVEVSRGCPWKCQFCATPEIYRPYRMRNKDVIMESIEAGIKHRKHVGLIGADILGHPEFRAIAEEILDRSLTFSLSSLRVNRITREVASLLARTGHRRATLGIEAGSERLRNKIEKSLSNDKIIAAVKNLAREGITNLKLYFMVGLPGETPDDIDAILDLIRKIRETILKERKVKTMSPDIVVVVTPFVPKKLTPFEGEKFAGKKYLQKTLKRLRKDIGKIPNTKITGESPRQAEVEFKLSHQQ